MVDEENKELEQEDKQEQKEENKEQAKRDIKLVITSVVATLLFIIILLLLVLLGIKKCSNDSTTSSSSSSEPESHEPTYNYTEAQVHKLDDKFKAIVNSYRNLVMGDTPDELVDIKSVTYTDNYETGKFSLSISVTSVDNKVYLYTAKDTFYPEDKSKFTNIVDYLLLDDTPDIFTEGDTNTEYSCNTYTKTEEVITTEQTSYKYVISSNATSDKFIDGFYYKDYTYHIYQHQTYNGTDPFTNDGISIGLDHRLYCYYQELNK